MFGKILSGSMSDDEVRGHETRNSTKGELNFTEI